MLANDALNPDSHDSLIALFLVTDTAEHYIQYQREDGSVGSEPASRFRQNKVCVTPPRNQSPKPPILP